MRANCDAGSSNGGCALALIGVVLPTDPPADYSGNAVLIVESEMFGRPTL